MILSELIAIFLVECIDPHDCGRSSGVRWSYPHDYITGDLSDTISGGFNPHESVFAVSDL